MSTNVCLLQDVLAVRATIDAHAGYGARSPTSEFTAQIDLVDSIGDLLRNAHPPCIDDQLVHLLAVEGIESDDDPVVAHVPGVRKQELVRLRRDERVAFLLGEGEAHQRLVLRERDEDDSTDAELDPTSREALCGTRESCREPPNIVERHHRANSRTPLEQRARSRSDLKMPNEFTGP